MPKSREQLPDRPPLSTEDVLDYAASLLASLRKLTAERDLKNLTQLLDLAHFAACQPPDT